MQIVLEIGEKMVLLKLKSNTFNERHRSIEMMREREGKKRIVGGGEQGLRNDDKIE